MKICIITEQNMDPNLPEINLIQTYQAVYFSTEYS